jgi:hypothetical protein
LEVTQTRQTELPEEAEEYCRYQDDVILRVAALHRASSYVHSVASYRLENGECTWRRELPASSSSSAGPIIVSGQLVYAVASHLLHVNPSTGDSIASLDLGEPLWGPLLSGQDEVFCSTESGLIYSYSVRRHQVSRVTRLYSNFHEACIRGDLLFAATQSPPRRRFFWQPHRTAAAVHAVDVHRKTARVLMDLGASTAFVSLSPADGGLLIARGGTVMRLDLASEVRWSYRLSESRFEQVRFHHVYKNSILVSAGHRLALLDLANGQPFWNHELYQGMDVDSAFLRGNFILFSTGNRGGPHTFGTGSENYIAVHNIASHMTTTVHTVHSTSHIRLALSGDEVLAMTVVKELREHDVIGHTLFMQFTLTE